MLEFVFDSIKWIFSGIGVLVLKPFFAIANRNSPAGVELTNYHGDDVKMSDIESAQSGVHIDNAQITTLSISKVRAGKRN